ncbi:MAG: hypothetical protein JO040_06690 [Gemmatimonadetes bacterium]|nr:hypothetical protein [Gemmatimonadota bacterium]
MEWEYSVVAEEGNVTNGEIMDGLNRAGVHGWELVAVVYHREQNKVWHYLKRPKEQKGEPRKISRIPTRSYLT